MVRAEPEPELEAATAAAAAVAVGSGSNTNSSVDNFNLNATSLATAIKNSLLLFSFKCTLVVHTNRLRRCSNCIAKTFPFETKCRLWVLFVL